METFIGDIQLFPYGFAPKYWAKCDGSIMQITENTALFSLIGIKFGGDGRVTFGLPNLQGAEPIPGVEYYISLQGIFPTRS
jgi:microcystin-dependent protein